MKKWVFILSIVVIACAKENEPVDQACIDEEKINAEAVCTMDYRPVCGCDGKTYSNVCVAESAGLLKWEEGECTEEG